MSVQHSYELSPRLSEQILQTAKQSLYQGERYQQGQIVVVVAGLEDKSGKQLARVEKRRVTLTVDNGTEDLQALQAFGRPGLRRTIIQRIAEEAIEQGGLLSGAELSVLLNRSLNTIQRYLKIYVNGTGKIPPLKGYVMDMGSLPTHKAIIISLYEQGMSPADIVLKTSHSQYAVDRYIKQYEQIRKLIKKGLTEMEIKDITRRSIKVVWEYIALYRDLHENRLEQS